MLGRAVSLSAILASLLTGAHASEDPIRPSLESIFRPPRPLGVRPQNPAISANGQWVIFEWTSQDAKVPARARWITATGSPTPRVLFSAEETVKTWWSPRAAELLVFHRGWLELRSPPDFSPSPPLFRIGETLGNLEFIDDGRSVVFSSGSDKELWVLDLETGARRRLARELRERSGWFQVLEDAARVALFAGDSEKSGEDAAATEEEKTRARVLYLVDLRGDAPPERVPLEEVRGLQLAPGGRWASRSESRSKIDRRLIMADYLTEAVAAVPVRNSLAGDPPATVELEIWDLERGDSFEPPVDEAERYFLRGSSWSPEGEHLLVHRLGEDHRIRQILVVHPASRRSWPIFTERDETWIQGPFLWAQWSDGGRHVLFTSEVSGFNHLYVVDREGGTPRQLTAGDFEIQRVVPMDRDAKRLLLIANEPDPAERHLYVLDVDTGERRKLPTPSGCAERPAVSHDGGTVVYLQERLGVPGDLFSLPTNGESEPVRLTDSVPAALSQLGLSPPTIVEYTNPDDGQRVRAFLYRPEPFDATRRYPAVIFVHGAGYLQNVTCSMSRYALNMLFHHRLARRGYFVLDPDYRHSAGYGRTFRTDVHGWMGGKDLDDVVAGVRYLGTLGQVDTTRVGIYGGSYGGFLTLMALFTRPEVFACGAALRSVTDWRVYHAGYTNPRLGSPATHPENYARSSPIDHAEGLLRPVLLLHGLKDRNVFAQDTIRLVEKLIQHGKDFELMLYPSQGHGFTDPESWIDEYRRIERFMDRYLEPEAPTTRRESF